MRRDEIVARLKEAEPAIRAHGVAGLYLFGSYARNEGHTDSDIDVFIDPISDETFGFLEFMAAYDAVRGAFGRQAEIGFSTREGLSRYIRPEVEKEAIKVF